MVTKRGTSNNSEKLDSISFRGNKDKWIDFQYAVKKEGHKNLWEVLGKLVGKYIKEHPNGDDKK